MTNTTTAAFVPLGFAAGWAGLRLLLRPKTAPLASAIPGGAVALMAPVAARSGRSRVSTCLFAGAAGALGGWTAAALTSLEEPDRTARRVPALAPTAARRVAVVYFTHGEPETYEPEPWVNMLHELNSTVPGFPPKPVWPFILASIKRSFAEVGTSPHGRIHADTMRAVEAVVARPDVSWYLAFLDAEPALRDAVAQAVGDGATDIVFLTVFLTDSDHTAEADGLDAAMGLSEAGIRVVRTPVLWDDPRLAQMVVDKVLRAAGDRDLSTVGVMLVGHGQPEQWDRTHPTETQQEVAFRAAISHRLVAQGLRADLVSDGWMSFREPKVPARVRELITRGARTIIGVPVTISADSLHSLYDTPKLVRRGARGSGAEVIDVGAWNTEPLLVELLAERATVALAQVDAVGLRAEVS